MSPRARALAATGLTAAVLLGAATATPWTLRIPPALTGEDVPLPDLPQPTASPPTAGPQPQNAGNGDDTLVTLLLIGALVVGLLLALLARRALAALRSTTPPPPEPDAPAPGADQATTPDPGLPLEQLHDAVTRALAHLDDAPTPHDAVVAAWVALEDTAREHGTPRDPAQTPTEFTTELLHTTPAPRTDVTTLRDLYHHARFAARPITGHHVQQARTALEHIARTLTPAHLDGPHP